MIFISWKRSNNFFCNLLECM